jgi:hypothetical protein
MTAAAVITSELEMSVAGSLHEIPRHKQLEEGGEGVQDSTRMRQKSAEIIVIFNNNNWC